MPSADLLLITVTKAETRAVFQCFREASGYDPRPLTVGDKTYHDLGTINETSVWQVQVEPGTAGSLAPGLETLWPSAAIMVGLAFGADSASQGMGDILVAKQLALYAPDDLPEPDAVLPRGPRVECSQHLFDRCRNAEVYWEGAKVRVGLLLSGTKLVENVPLVQALLRHEPEAIGGELEANGAQAACEAARVDWLVVKAICDWGDGEKSLQKNERLITATRNAAQFILHTLQTVGLKLLRNARADS